ncbi:NADH-dependent [FeFe] hydrogenase, group A6 [Succinispira mobilis]|uniref:NADH-dependent [FeFe] hydrogenase, group A6 n=1 Tax=Succinispira mobilis TaxID=78120 RepID=UPI00036CD2F8|nr:NADH-dependent [FeFe] hydrogenase, group A6 [Succinispira mobilis]
MNSKVNITIDGKIVSVSKDKSLLKACQQAGVNVPSLCYHPELRTEGSCRVCMVEVEGQRTLVPSCVFPVTEGMQVRTNTQRVLKARKTVVELLLANHPQDCLTCQRNGNCELQKIAADLNLRKIRFEGEKKSYPLDNNNPSLVRDMEKCILCGRCVRMCAEKQGMHIYGFINRGFDTTVAPPFSLGLDKVDCTYCGQCATVCPTAAIVEKDDTEAVLKVLNDPTKHVVVQTAPATRVALGEDLGLERGAIVTGKMVAALKHLGFDKVFDTNFSADLTIMEEGAEFIHRLNNGGLLPMFTSCSPAWVNCVELQYPDLMGHLSTAKSPQQMFGAMVKSYYAEVAGIDPKNIVSVSIMPCTAKKAEAKRPEMSADGYQDVDFVLTTRELARMIKESAIDFNSLAEQEYDAPMGLSSGAGVIFGTTGGVMEAALRTVVEKLTGKPLERIVFNEVRGQKLIREATLDVAGTAVKIAVVDTLKEVKKMLEKVRAGTADYHIIEVMSCPDGCIGGGGQPYYKGKDVRTKRQQAIYDCDADCTIRKSHENPAIVEIYEKFLGEPLSEKSHKYLHVHHYQQKR